MKSKIKDIYLTIGAKTVYCFRWDERLGEQRKAITFYLLGREFGTIYYGKGRYYTKIRVWKNTLIHRIIKRINTYRKKIINWHRWDEMDDKQRKAITFSIFNYYAGTIYYGRGIYYGG